MLRQRVGSRLQANPGLAIILTLFLALGITYSVMVPPFESPDEVWHYLYVKYVADRKGLPVYDGVNPLPMYQEASQPPLYYLVAGLATAWIDTSDADDLIRFNPHAARGLASAEGNKNVVLHTDAEAFPYRGTTLAVHVARLISVAVGAATVACTYLVARLVFPEHPGLVLAATAVHAFNPEFLFISASVNNDVLVNFLGSLALWLLLSVIRTGPSTAQLIGLGAVLGLAAVSKLSGLVLIPLAALALGWAAWRRRSGRLAVRWGLLVAIPVLITGGWWYARNWLLYRDPLGLRLMFGVEQFRPRTERPDWPEILQLFEGVRKSFWAVFGWFNVVVDPWIYTVLDVLVALGVVGLAIFAAWRLARGEGARLDAPAGGSVPGALKGKEGRAGASAGQMAFLALWVLTFGAALLGWGQVRYPQGRHLFPALSAVAVLLVAGWAGWVPQRWRALPGYAVAGGLLVLATVAPFRYIVPAYARPPTSPSASQVQVPNPLEVDFGGKLRLLGYGLDRATVRPGETLHLTLLWQALARMQDDYSVFVHLVSPEEIIVAQTDTHPGLGNYPTSTWPVGVVVQDVYPVTLPATALAPATLSVVVGVYDFDTMQRLTADTPTGEPRGDSVTLARVSLAPNESPLGVPHPVRFELGRRIALVGFDLDRAVARPGEALDLTLYWQALAPVGEDFTVFTHVLGEGSQIWAQHDGQPQGGRAPTSDWSPGEIVVDEHELVIHPQTPPGVYELEVGMYRSDTGQRLKVGMRDDRILLAKIRVE